MASGQETLWRRGARRLAAEGRRLHPQELWWSFWKSRRDRQFDRRHNIDTAGTLLPSAFGVPKAAHRLSVRYLSSEPEEFERGILRLPQTFEDFTFIDLGSGKGKVLFMASAYPFRRIVGVELSPKLHRVAELNVGKYRSSAQRCHRIELVCANALEYEFPEEPIVVYLYNPFLAELQGRVAARLRASYERNPRPVYVVYINPVHAGEWERAGFGVVERGDLLAILSPVQTL
jgi:SAM-dependent methyltransferase